MSGIQFLAKLEGESSAALQIPRPRRFSQEAFRPYSPTASLRLSPILNTHLAKK